MTLLCLYEAYEKVFTIATEFLFHSSGFLMMNIDPGLYFSFRK